MLKGIDPLLGPGLLGILRAMGHGDEIVVADANFPATSIAHPRRLVRADGIDAPRMVRAIVSVLPLDDFVPAAVFGMAEVKPGDKDADLEYQFVTAARSGGYAGTFENLERHAFYARAKAAYAVVATGETRLYGNLILKKGVIRPPGR